MVYIFPLLLIILLIWVYIYDSKKGERFEQEVELRLKVYGTLAEQYNLQPLTTLELEELYSKLNTYELFDDLDNKIELGYGISGQLLKNRLYVTDGMVTRTGGGDSGPGPTGTIIKWTCFYLHFEGISCPKLKLVRPYAKSVLQIDGFEKLTELYEFQSDDKINYIDLLGTELLSQLEWLFARYASSKDMEIESCENGVLLCSRLCSMLEMKHVLNLFTLFERQLGGMEEVE